MSDPNEAFERAIGEAVSQRGKFDARALVISGAAFLAGLWVTAPSLSIAIPIAPGATPKLNVGYVLVGALPVLAVALALNASHIVQMRRAQARARRLAEGDQAASADLLAQVIPWQRRRVPLSNGASEWMARLDSSLGWVALAARLIVSFLLPLLASSLIFIEYVQVQKYDDRKCELHCVGEWRESVNQS